MPSWIRYQCDQILSPTRDIRLITLSPSPQLQPQSHESILFTPGQYIEAQLGDYRLPLSIANTPNAEGTLEFHIRLYPNTLAEMFVNQLLTQGVIDLQGPFGNFTSDQVQCDRPLFLAGGVGLAPIQSLLTHLLLSPQHSHRTFHLFWGVKQANECYREALLREWEKRYPQFELTIALSGFIHEVLIDSYPNLYNAQIFACGPQAMIATALPALKAQGLQSHCFVCDQ